MTNISAIPAYRGTAAAPSPNDPTPSGGGPSVMNRSGSANDLSRRGTPGAEAPRLARTMSLPSLPTRESPPLQAGVLNAAFVALAQLPEHERAGKSSALMQPLAQMLDSPADEKKRLDVASKLLTAASGLDSAPRSQMLTVIAERLDRLPAAAQANMFGEVARDSITQLSTADMRAPLQALAGKVDVFPKGERFGAITTLAFQNKNSKNDSLKDRVLAPPDQAQLLATLAKGVGSTQDPLKAFDFLNGTTLKLPPELRLPSLEALREQIHALKPEERLVPVWNLRCETKDLHAEPLSADRKALDATDSLPENQQAILLMTIIDQSTNLSKTDRSTLLGEVEQKLGTANWFMADSVRAMLKAATGASS